MIKMVAEVLAIWLILSCPLGVLVGKILKFGNHDLSRVDH